MRRVIVTLLICVFALGMNAQDMTSVFTAMPDQYIPQLEHAWRKDLVDLYTSGKESRLKNTMNGFSTLQKLTNDYLLLQTTERSTVEMKLLPLVNNTSHLDMDLIQYRLSPDDQTLTAIYTTPQYLSQEAREKIEPYLIEPKVYTWQKYHFQ